LEKEPQNPDEERKVPDHLPGVEKTAGRVGDAGLLV